jgi:hypothetical protein
MMERQVRLTYRQEKTTVILAYIAQWKEVVYCTTNGR